MKHNRQAGFTLVAIGMVMMMDVVTVALGAWGFYKWKGSFGWIPKPT